MNSNSGMKRPLLHSIYVKGDGARIVGGEVPCQAHKRARGGIGEGEFWGELVEISARVCRHSTTDGAVISIERHCVGCRCRGTACKRIQGVS